MYTCHTIKVAGTSDINGFRRYLLLSTAAIKRSASDSDRAHARAHTQTRLLTVGALVLVLRAVASLPAGRALADERAVLGRRLARGVTLTRSAHTGVVQVTAQTCKHTSAIN